MFTIGHGACVAPRTTTFNPLRRSAAFLFGKATSCTSQRKSPIRPGYRAQLQTQPTAIFPAQPAFGGAMEPVGPAMRQQKQLGMQLTLVRTIAMLPCAGLLVR